MTTPKKYTAVNYSWLVAFFIWPFGAFLASLRTIGNRVFSVMLVLFYFLYGFTYIIAGKDQDTYRTSQYFKEAAKLSFGDLWDKIENLFAITNKPDFFQDLLQYLVSRFTDDVRVYFAVTAVMFAIVSAIIFEDVYRAKDVRFKTSIMVVLASLFLLLVLSPGRINSFRHYMATAIFLFAMNRYLSLGGLKYLAMLFVTPFIHFAFIMIVPLIILYKIIGDRYVVYYALIVLSFIFSSQVSSYVNELTTTLDESAIQYHANRYTSDVYIKQVQELKAQRYYVLDKYTYFTTLFFLAVMLLHHKAMADTLPQFRKLFGVSLIIFAFVNLFSELESVSNRFGVLYQGFCCLFLIAFYLRGNKPMPWAVQGTFGLVLLVNALVVVRIVMQSASISTMLLFFPVSLATPIDVSVLDWLR